MAVNPKSPPPNKVGNQLTAQVVENLEWLNAHPGEWLLWGVKDYPMQSKQVAGVRFERRYSKILEGPDQGKWEFYVKLRTKGEQ